MSKLRATILTGFLGAGKTTLLNHLLLDGSHERIAIIVNEYGQIGIDGKLVVETQDEVIELNNGCICCTVRSDLIGAIGDLLRSGRKIDRIIVETSGLADPAPVIQSFILDNVLAKNVVLDAIVTVVDARHIGDQLQNSREAVEQITFADVLLLNKTDLESGDALDAIERKVRRLNPLAKIIRTKDCNVARSDVLDVGAFDLQHILNVEPNLLDGDHDHEHDRSVGCIAIQSTTPSDPVALNAWLNKLVQLIGKDLFRMKGVIAFRGEKRRFVFHGVHMTLEGRPGRPWGESEHRFSEIVFIGRNLDEQAIRSGFAACLGGEEALAS
jgi:G3E family GTPase